MSYLIRLRDVAGGAANTKVTIVANNDSDSKVIDSDWLSAESLNYDSQLLVEWRLASNMDDAAEGHKHYA